MKKKILISFIVGIVLGLALELPFLIYQSKREKIIKDPLLLYQDMNVISLPYSQRQGLVGVFSEEDFKKLLKINPDEFFSLIIKEEKEQEKRRKIWR